jgi:hypothetical protein
MSNDIYPSDVRGLKFNVVKAPRFSTLIQSAPNGFETRIRQAQNPMWKWTLLYDYLYASSNGQYNNQLLAGRTYPDLQLLMGFFAGHAGQWDDFLFLDPDDNTVGPGLNPDSTPNTLAQQQLFTDGTLFYTPLQRNLGGQFYEDITDLVDGTLVVYANGVEQIADTDYTLKGPGFAIQGASWAGMYLEWAAEPTEPITAEFQFYFRVIFNTDEQDFEKFLEDLWTIGGHGGGQLELRTSRPQIACTD